MADHLAVRRAAQEIISAHVLATYSDSDRDLTIATCHEEHGDELVWALYAFVVYHLVELTMPSSETISDDGAAHDAGRVLYALGDMLEAIAREGDAPVDDVLRVVVRGEVRADADDPEVDSDRLEAISQAVRAAQASLIAHFLVRRGHEPIGVLRHLNLTDMRAMQKALTVLGHVLIDFALHGLKVSCPALVGILLAPVAAILAGIAQQRGEAIEDTISAYWTALAVADGSREPS